MLFRLPFRTVQATYRIDDDQIHIDWGSSEPALSALGWELDELVSQLSSGEAARFHRLAYLEPIAKRQRTLERP